MQIALSYSRNEHLMYTLYLLILREIKKNRFIKKDKI